MTKLFALAALLLVFALPVRADHLDGIVPLAKDDLAAVSQAAAVPGRHAMLFFGDHAN